MDTQRLRSLLSKFPALTLLVVGDFFLDYYLEIDAHLAETSLETGLEAHQVVRVRFSPGAAGTVTSNLRALGVNVLALGVLGDDGSDDGGEQTSVWQIALHQIGASPCLIRSRQTSSFSRAPVWR